MKIFEKLANAIVGRLEKGAEEFDQRQDAQAEVEALRERVGELEDALREVLDRFAYQRDSDRSYYLVFEVRGDDYRRWARIAGIKK